MDEEDSMQRDDFSSSSNSVARQQQQQITREHQPMLVTSTISGTVKTGRKGDPRMHKAVAARLANPKCSLFEALIIGGFEYPDDEDANHVDSEKIALGQRKNQLSRRVRLAKRQGSGYSPNQDGHPAAPFGNEIPKSHPPGEATDQISGVKRPNTFSEDVCCDDGNVVSMNETGKLREEDTSEKLRLVARNHPDYRPIVIPHIGHAVETNNVDGFVAMNQAYQQMGGVGTLTPSSFPSNPGSGGGGGGSLPPGSAATTAPGGHHQPHTMMLPGTSSTTVPRDNRNNTSATQEAATDSGPPAPFNGAAFSFGDQPTDHQRDGVVTHSFPPAAGTNPASNETSAEASLNSVNSQQQRQQQQQGQHPAVHSGVAVASLTQTAASVGMSLEQLAVALRTGNTLAKCLNKCAATPQSQKDLAVALYQSENRSLYTRSMLMAGYRTEFAQDETSAQYLDVAWEAWNREGHRLQELTNQRQPDEPPLEANAPSADPGSSGSGGVGAGGGRSPGPSQDGSGNREGGEAGLQFGQNQGHHEHQHQGGGSSSGGAGQCAFSKGRHIHRLEGQCGHKAILHQPSNGSVHIDFVIGDRVECYQGVQPISQQHSSIKIWPSNFRCRQLHCEDSCKVKELQRSCCGDKELNKKTEEQHNPADCVAFADPKILDLADIDLESEEWNANFAVGESESVLGLFKLGDSSIEEEGKKKATPPIVAADDDKSAE